MAIFFHFLVLQSFINTVKRMEFQESELKCGCNYSRSQTEG